jgi:hypothetical protein
MRKTFSFISETKKPERVADKIKHELKKYITRERKKKLPESFNVWHFDCKVGLDDQQTYEIKISDLNKKVDEYQKKEVDTFYVEITAKPANKK